MRTDLALRLACVENWLTDRIRQGLGALAQAAEVRTTAHLGRADSRFNTHSTLSLFARLDEVRALKAALAGPINRSLALESLLRSLAGERPSGAGRQTREAGHKRS
jgi:hypothetical protein